MCQDNPNQSSHMNYIRYMLLALSLLSLSAFADKKPAEVFMAETVLEKLMKKRDEVRQKELLNAFAASNKSFEEVMSFLRGGSPEE